MTPRVLGLRQGTLAFAEYNSSWPEAFRTEANVIASLLPETSFRIAHIGSTAVPGLLAKPILDIGMEAGDHETVATALTSAGYIDRGERSGRLFIRLRDNDIRTHNLHLYRPASPELKAQIAFRDQLRADKALRTAYAAEKLRIFAASKGKRRGYAEAKTDFIMTALSAAPPFREAT